MANAWDERKKGLEEEYFHRKEQEALEKTRQRLTAEARERDETAVALMRCPKCAEELEEIAFQGIQVDRCTGCQGVWLDPGEIERLTAKDNQGWLARFWHSTAH
jgi:hypothetical protein